MYYLEFRNIINYNNYNYIYIYNIIIIHTYIYIYTCIYIYIYIYILSRYVVNGETDAVCPDKKGTKVAAYYVLEVPSGGEATVKFRLCDEDSIPKKG